MARIILFESNESLCSLCPWWLGLSVPSVAWIWDFKLRATERTEGTKKNTLTREQGEKRGPKQPGRLCYSKAVAFFFCCFGRLLTLLP